MNAMHRLLQTNMVLSSTQPQTGADGNCFLYCILDQLRYDPVWSFGPFTSDTFRSSVVSSLNLMVSQGRIESPFTVSQSQEWIRRMSTNYEFADHIFIQLQPEFQSTDVSKDCHTATCNQNSTVFQKVCKRKLKKGLVISSNIIKNRTRNSKK